MSWKAIFIICMIIFCLPQQSITQCPDDPNELLINTEEKYDTFFEKYPNCKEFRIVMFNGKFTGDSRPIEYLLTLSVILLATLLVLKIIFIRLKII